MAMLGFNWILENFAVRNWGYQVQRRMREAYGTEFSKVKFLNRFFTNAGSFCNWSESLCMPCECPNAKAFNKWGGRRLRQLSFPKETRNLGGEKAPKSMIWFLDTLLSLTLFISLFKSGHSDHRLLNGLVLVSKGDCDIELCHHNWVLEPEGTGEIIIYPDYWLVMWNSLDHSSWPHSQRQTRGEIQVHLLLSTFSPSCIS